MPTFNPQLMRTIILNHYDQPYHKKTPVNKEEYLQIHLHATGCIDDITLFLKVKENKVSEAFFDGIGCTISISSTSILLTMIEGMEINDVIHLVDEYQKMLNQQPFDEQLLEEAVVFQNTAKQPSRIKCALIGWEGALKLLNNEVKEDK